MDSALVYTIARHALHMEPTFQEDCCYLGHEDVALLLFDAKLWAVFGAINDDARRLGSKNAFPFYVKALADARDLILNTDTDNDAALGVYVRTVELLNRVLAGEVCRG